MIRRTMVFAGLFLLMSGCGTVERNRNLQMVAKDWCMVIRASQIVPVYPLTEDLQVGDIFLVQRTVDDQHAEYEKRGFLPMDNLLYRLEPAGYSEFYELSFAPDETNLELPKDWLNAGANVSWHKAPGANFPSYSFSVRSGAGLNVAVPLQGVPVGLSLLGADGGEGTITIREAKTYGIDTISLYDDVLAWERTYHEFLLNYASTEEKTNYIRVISRVFLAKSMNVSIRASRTREGGVSAGAPKPVELLTIKTAKDESGLEAATTENYTNGIEALNDSIAKALEATDEVTGNVLPGGTLKVVAASSRAITMEETFERPLAVGYLGFDMVIGPDGFLGSPIPTHAVLKKEIALEPVASDTIQLLGNARLTSAYEIIRKQADAGEEGAIRLKAKLDQVATLLPEKYPVPIYSIIAGSNQLQEQIPKDEQLQSDPPRFDDLTTYRGQLITSSDALEEADEELAERKQWLQPTQKALEDVRVLLRQHRALLEEANKYAGYF